MSAPNKHVQRTRVARFARAGSPLTRRPLGGLRRVGGEVAWLLVLVVAACHSTAGAQDTCKRNGVVSDESSELIGAAGSGDVGRVKKLIGEGADVNFQECADRVNGAGNYSKVYGWTAVMIAAAHGQNDVVRLLVSAGAKLDTRSSQGETALGMAAEGGHQSTVTLLRQLGAHE